MIVLVVAVVFMLIWWLLTARRAKGHQHAVEGQWASRTVSSLPTVPSSSLQTSRQSAASSRTPTPRSPRPARVVAALIPGEMRRWLRTPSFALAVVFSGMALWALYFFGSTLFEPNELSAMAANIPITAWPVVGLMIIAMHRAATWPRRLGADEMFSATPTSAATRSTGAVGIAISALILCSLLAVVHLVAIGWKGAHGGVSVRALQEIAIIPLLCIGGAALSLLLVRVGRWFFIPILAVIGVAAASGNLMGPRQWSTRRWLGIWPGFAELPTRFDTRPVVAHLLSVAAMTLVVVAIVIVVARVGWRSIVGLGVAVVLLVVAQLNVANALQPSPAATRAIARQITDPIAYQFCSSTKPVVVCAYRPYDAEVGAVSREASTIVDHVPRAARAALSTMWLIQRLDDGQLAKLNPRIGRATQSMRHEHRASSAMSFGFISVLTTDGRMAARALVASRIVGLPVTFDQRVVCSAAGQPRGVVALWLAGQAPNFDAHDLVRHASRSLSAYGADSGGGARNTEEPLERQAVVPWNDDVVKSPSRVTWSLGDIRAAQRLLALPRTDVERTIAAHWDELVDPHADRPLFQRIFGFAITFEPSSLDAC